MNLVKLINEEQLFNICATLVSINDDYFDGVAGEILTAKAIKDLYKKNKDFTDEDVANKINEFIISKALEELVRKGEVEADLSENETIYRKVKRKK
jgi:hypothetical protein